MAANVGEIQIIQELEKLVKKVDYLTTIVQPKPHTDLKELNGALAQAQADFKVARPSKEDNYFKMKYEALADVINASRQYLAKNGLSVRFEQNVTVDGTSLLTCVLAHASGQEVRSSVRVLPSKNDPRSHMSEVEYLKRMLYSGLTGVVADDDDNAEMAMMDHREEEERGTSLTTKYNPKENPRITITPEQLEELNFELQEHADLAEKVKQQLNLRYLADMPKDKFRDAMERIRKIKAIRNGK